MLSFQGLRAFCCDMENLFWANPWDSEEFTSTREGNIISELRDDRQRAERGGGNELNHENVALWGIGRQRLNLEGGSCPKPAQQGQARGEDSAGSGDQTVQKQKHTTHRQLL